MIIYIINFLYLCVFKVFCYLIPYYVFCLGKSPQNVSDERLLLESIEKIDIYYFFIIISISHICKNDIYMYIYYFYARSI